LRNLQIKPDTNMCQVRAGERPAATAEETPPSMQAACAGDS